MPIRQSISWWCFAGKGVSEEDLLKKARAIGYQAVELIGQNLFDRVRDAGFVIASHGGHRGISSGLNDPSQHDRIEAEIHKNLELAVQYEIPNLIVFSGERSEGLSEAEGAENCAQGLRRVAKAAEEAGVNLVMELLNSKVDHKGYQCDHTDWGVQVCEMVGSPRVKLLYDIYHMQIMEGDIIRTIQNQHTHFAHYHTAGNPGRRDMDETQELYYPPIMQAIVATGYDGYVGHEFIPKGDPLAALEAAFQLCDM
ncbi:MAG: TIM barrel protein [Armatimonadetes bacterium]|nr:TIM barrel protein [Armatimonadota bacterium]